MQGGLYFQGPFQVEGKVVKKMWSALLGKSKPKPEEKKTKLSSLVQQQFGPPLVAEEQKGNLSEIEKRFNREMKCPAGKNQVFIRSLVSATGTTQPRIALKCHLRKDAGMPAEVFFEHIRDVCCTNPDNCPAYKKFKDRFVPT